ncbi:MAG: hypothetical protein CMH54_10240 [Myxococcales bacterium]|nr:hypothetical protein [Myxococcales bacterium]
MCCKGSLVSIPWGVILSRSISHSLGLLLILGMWSCFSDGTVPKPTSDSDTYIPAVECTGPGCIGDLCVTDTDCSIGPCVWHQGDQVCTEPCAESCPNGWSCRTRPGSQDTTTYCISDAPVLCLMCLSDTDCTAKAGEPTACLDYFGGGTYCGSECGPGKDCPDGYECVDGWVWGKPSQCIPPDHTCECTETAIRLHLSVTCSNSNDFGSCTGSRFCTEAGLSDCDAREAFEEICDGKDNDCDGMTDNDICADDNPCTEDACTPATGCSHIPVSGIFCDDDDPCTETDTCTDGVCLGVEVDCNDANPCTDDSCVPGTGCVNAPNTLSCSDGDPCTIGDRCSNAECVSGETIICDDGNPCTDDICDVDAGCRYEHNSAPCNDSNYCTEDDTCQNGFCVGQTATPCDDGNSCTTDGCLPLTGCVNVANEAPCNDGDLCSLNDVCTDGVCAAGASTLLCNDSNYCTDDSCDPLLGCVFTPNTLPCNDQNDCTANDACSAGVCVGSGAMDCDDGNPCTKDLCDDGCQYLPIDGMCTDNNMCSLNDSCSDGICSSGDMLICNDGNPCTDDSCHPETGCVFENNTDYCDDSSPCTLIDQCVDGVCIGEGDLDCDDGNGCTADSCHPISACVHTNVNIVCDDGNACTTGDICQSGSCIGPDIADCSDADLCTDDLCDPGLGCYYELNSNPCDDGDFCTTEDTCTDGECVGSGVLCKDEDVCTFDECIPATGCYFPTVPGCCGNLIVEEGEACDDGNQAGGDGCASDCSSDESCGNGLIDLDEVCDGEALAEPCPLENCVCSSDCTLKFETVEGVEGWESGVFDGTNTNPPNPLHPACSDENNICIDPSTKALTGVWIANSASHTVARFNADTGTADLVISSYGQHPSRTAVVVRDGSVWVGNRGLNCQWNAACSNVVHFRKNGEFICRADVLGLVRALAIDADGNVWASSWSQKLMYKISGTEVDTTQDPARCVMEATVPVAGKPYGAIGDSKGNVWIINNSNWQNSQNVGVQSLQQIDIATNSVVATYVPPASVHTCYNNYGLSMDVEGRVLIGSYRCKGLFRYTPETDTWEWYSIPEGTPRGLTTDNDGYIYTALSHSNPGGGAIRKIARVHPSFAGHSILDLGNAIRRIVGISFDKNGWLWTAGRDSGTAARVNTANWDTGPEIDIKTTFGSDPYTYSDFTGIQFLRFVNPEGSWTRIFDSTLDAPVWETAEWTGLEEPGITDIQIRVRTASNLPGLSSVEWSEYASTLPVDLGTLLTDHKRYLEVELLLSSNDPKKTPVLETISVQWSEGSP